MVIERIRMFIEEKGIKQYKISEISGLTPTNLSLSLNNKRKTSPDELRMIIFALSILVPGTTANDFFNLNELLK